MDSIPAIPTQATDRLPLFGRGGTLVAWALIDPEDFDRCAALRWNLGTGGYVIHSDTVTVGFRTYKRKTTRLHRLILNNPTGVVDHVNHNKLDNRKNNLRVCTNAENLRNREGLPKHNTSGALGVYWVKTCQAWMAMIGVDGKQMYLGLFNDKCAAIQARDEAAMIYHGEFAALNAHLNIT